MAFKTLPDILNKINLWIYDVLKTSYHNFDNSDFFIMKKLQQFYVFTAANK